MGERDCQSLLAQDFLGGFFQRLLNQLERVLTSAAGVILEHLRSGQIGLGDS
jgi:hypothetical protein